MRPGCSAPRSPDFTARLGAQLYGACSQAHSNVAIQSLIDGSFKEPALIPTKLLSPSEGGHNGPPSASTRAGVWLIFSTQLVPCARNNSPTRTYRDGPRTWICPTVPVSEYRDAVLLVGAADPPAAVRAQATRTQGRIGGSSCIVRVFQLGAVTPHPCPLTTPGTIVEDCPRRYSPAASIKGPTPSTYIVLFLLGDRTYVYPGVANLQDFITDWLLTRLPTLDQSSACLVLYASATSLDAGDSRICQACTANYQRVAKTYCHVHGCFNRPWVPPGPPPRNVSVKTGASKRKPWRLLLGPPSPFSRPARSQWGITQTWQCRQLPPGRIYAQVEVSYTDRHGQITHHRFTEAWQVKLNKNRTCQNGQDFLLIPGTDRPHHGWVSFIAFAWFVPRAVLSPQPSGATEADAPAAPHSRRPPPHPTRFPTLEQLGMSRNAVPVAGELNAKTGTLPDPYREPAQAIYHCRIEWRGDGPSRPPDLDIRVQHIRNGGVDFFGAGGTTTTPPCTWHFPGASSNTPRCARLHCTNARRPGRDTCGNWFALCSQCQSAPKGDLTDELPSDHANGGRSASDKPGSALPMRWSDPTPAAAGHDPAAFTIGFCVLPVVNLSVGPRSEFATTSVLLPPEVNSAGQPTSSYLSSPQLARTVPGLPTEELLTTRLGSADLLEGWYILYPSLAGSWRLPDRGENIQQGSGSLALAAGQHPLSVALADAHAKSHRWAITLLNLVSDVGRPEHTFALILDQVERSVEIFSAYGADPGHVDQPVGFRNLYRPEQRTRYLHDVVAGLNCELALRTAASDAKRRAGQPSAPPTYTALDVDPTVFGSLCLDESQRRPVSRIVAIRYVSLRLVEWGLPRRQHYLRLRAQFSTSPRPWLPPPADGCFATAHAHPSAPAVHAALAKVLGHLPTVLEFTERFIDMHGSAVASSQACQCPWCIFETVAGAASWCVNVDTDVASAALRDGNVQVCPVRKYRAPAYTAPEHAEASCLGRCTYCVFSAYLRIDGGLSIRSLAERSLAENALEYTGYSQCSHNALPLTSCQHLGCDQARATGSMLCVPCQSSKDEPCEQCRQFAACSICWRVIDRINDCCSPNCPGESLRDGINPDYERQAPTPPQHDGVSYFLLPPQPMSMCSNDFPWQCFHPGCRQPATISSSVLRDSLRQAAYSRNTGWSSVDDSTCVACCQLHLPEFSAHGRNPAPAHTLVQWREMALCLLQRPQTPAVWSGLERDTPQLDGPSLDLPDFNGVTLTTLRRFGVGRTAFAHLSRILFGSHWGYTGIASPQGRDGHVSDTPRIRAQYLFTQWSKLGPAARLGLYDYLDPNDLNTARDAHEQLVALDQAVRRAAACASSAARAARRAARQVFVYTHVWDVAKRNGLSALPAVHRTVLSFLFGSDFVADRCRDSPRASTHADTSAADSASTDICAHVGCRATAQPSILALLCDPSPLLCAPCAAAVGPEPFDPEVPFCNRCDNRRAFPYRQCPRHNAFFCNSFLCWPDPDRPPSPESPTVQPFKRSRQSAAGDGAQAATASTADASPGRLLQPRPRRRTARARSLPADTMPLDVLLGHRPCDCVWCVLTAALQELPVDSPERPALTRQRQQCGWAGCVHRTSAIDPAGNPSSGCSASSSPEY